MSQVPDSVHPAAAALPMMTDAEFDDLCDDVKAHGLRLPIITYKGEVLDGRHRLNACKKVGVEPRFKEYDGDPVALVKSLNLARRDLTPSQRAAVAVELESMFKEAAEKRMKSGTKPRSTSENRKLNNPTTTLSEGSGEAIAQAAKAAGAGVGTAKQAKAVKKADPDLFNKVKQGTVKVNDAAKQVKAKQLQDAVNNLETAVNKQDPSAASDLDRSHLRAVWSKASAGLKGVVVLDPEHVLAVLTPDEVRFYLVAHDLYVAWFERFRKSAQTPLRVVSGGSE